MICAQENKRTARKKFMDINRYSPRYGVSYKHMTKLADFTTEEIFEFLYAARAMKDKFIAHESTKLFNDVTIALLFGDTSLRTRSALEIAAHQLGGACINLPYNERDIRAGENIKDIVTVLARYGVGALVTRGIKQRELDDYVSVSPIPIINSTNDDFDPLQTVCDLFTIWEVKKKLEGLKIAYIGKGTHVAASLIMGSVKCGLEVAVATPAEFRLKREHILRAEQFGAITLTDDPYYAAKDADIIYTDSYRYHSKPSEEEMHIMAPYKINNSVMSAAKPDAIFMHPLPASRGVEVAPNVIDGKFSVVMEQAENKLHAIKGILALLID